MLPVANLKLDVPVGQCWYDDTVLGDRYRGSVMVGNWGDRTVSWHKVAAAGAGFVAPSETLLTGDGIIRPVSAMPTNDGRLIVAVCYMKGNEGSPVRQTDLLLISPKAGQFPHRDFSEVPLVDLLDSPWQLRAKAHQEILRAGGETRFDNGCVYRHRAGRAKIFQPHLSSGAGGQSRGPRSHSRVGQLWRHDGSDRLASSGESP